ncbi:hypothetical protein WG66_004423, partial [Moniliophthora roreri]
MYKCAYQGESALIYPYFKLVPRVSRPMSSHLQSNPRLF